MAQGYIQIKIDNELKNEFMEVCADIGISATSACLVFVKKVVNERKIPFELTAKNKKSKAEPHWVVDDDCENFTAHCSDCGQIVDSRKLPKECPKCGKIMQIFQKT